MIKNLEMTESDFNLETNHILASFDSELENLFDLAIKMTSLTLYQLESAIKAIQLEDTEHALVIIADNNRVKLMAAAIDAEVLSLLARQQPVAKDLRAILSTAKISNELDKINSEICGIAHLILAIYEPRLGGVNLELSEEIIHIGECLEQMLKKLVLSFWNRQTHPAYALLEASRNCELELQTSIKAQLTFAVTNTRLVSRTIDVIEILKSFENCLACCRHIAENLIYMVDGQDIRHQNLSESVTRS